MSGIAYFYISEGTNLGPVSKEELIDLNLAMDTPVWFEGLNSWETIETIPELVESYQKKIETLNQPSVKIKECSHFQHPQDISAIKVLKKLKGLDTLAKLMNQWGYEKMLYTELISNCVKVDSEQLPKIYNILKESCIKMDVEEPLLFIEGIDSVSAYVSGIEKPMMVISRGLIEQFSDEEIKFIIGHELGHIKCNHVLYSMLMGFLNDFATLISSKGLGIATLLTTGIETALYNWYRKGELSCDRAGLLVCEDLKPAISSFMKIAGGGKYFQEQLSDGAFLKQADLYEELNSNLVDLFYKFLAIKKRTHPDTVVRAKELKEWYDSDEYRYILSGETEKLKPVGTNANSDQQIGKDSDIIEDLADKFNNVSSGIKEFLK